MRYMALDVGHVRIGVALSDPTGMFASPHEVIKRDNDDDVLKRLVALVNEKAVEKIIIGLPRHLDGREGAAATAVRDFAEKLQLLIDTEIEFFDERFSSLAADRILLEGNVRRADRKKKIDKMAAQIILQTYLDRASNTSIDTKQS